ncbi:MAG: hypothetical protein ACYTEZ_19275 [Planctomycetota bacterium]|jgi:hypothetical protein
MSKFAESLAGLEGKKVRFYLGGGDRGYVQGPVKKVSDNYIFIEKEGEIRGTMHTITINADDVRYYEIDTLVR